MLYSLLVTYRDGDEKSEMERHLWGGVAETG